MEYRISVKTMTFQMQNNLNRIRGGYRPFVWRTQPEAKQWLATRRAFIDQHPTIECSRLFIRTEGNVHYYVRQWTIRAGEMTLTTDRVALLNQKVEYLASFPTAQA